MLDPSFRWDDGEVVGKIIATTGDLRLFFEIAANNVKKLPPPSVYFREGDFGSWNMLDVLK